MTRRDHSKILLRPKSAAPFAAFVTARRAAPLSSSSAHPPSRATIVPRRPTPGTLSPGPAERSAPSILSQTRSARAATISIGRDSGASLPAEAANEPVVAMSTAAPPLAVGGAGPSAGDAAPPSPARLGEDRQVFEAVDARLPPAVGEHID